MTSADFLSEVCEGLFRDYPLAVTPDKPGAPDCSMILMVRNGHNADFFILSRGSREGQYFYSLRPWLTGEAANIEIDASDVSRMTLKVVTRGVPMPRHGSLLGWARGTDISALIAFYATYSPMSPDPYWAVMPLADIPQSSWPPFAGEPFFGCWFWEYYKARNISPLDDIIAETPGTVFWVNTKAVLGSDCCAVARDITSPEGYTLRRGRYVYHETLQAPKPVPPLGKLLATVDRTDLASRFHQPERADACA